MSKLSKEVRVASQKVISLIKSSEYYVAGVELSNSLENVTNCTRNIASKKPGTFFILTSPGDSELLISCAGPDNENFKSIDWLRYIIEDFENPDLVYDTNITIAIINKCDKSPFIMVEQVRAKAFKYLRDMNLLEEESEEDFIGFDDI